VQRKKEQFSVLMSEHERDVHNKDILNYQHMKLEGHTQGDPV
jgi:hypothetical protein